MAVYVDKEMNRHGRMIMCHMMADTVDELHAMADRIGVSRCWIQYSRSGFIHYDICQTKRRLALRLGAVEIGRQETVKLMLIAPRKIILQDGRIEIYRCPDDLVPISDDFSVVSGG